MYKYENEKSWIFTEEGSRQFLKVRDNVNSLLFEAGAVSMHKAILHASGDIWKLMACVDRMVELEEIREVNRGPSCPGQFRIFVKPKE